MTDREKAIVMAYTGTCMLTGDKFQIFHKYVEDIMGRPILTHEIGWLADAIKENSKADFMALCADESSSEKPNKWIPVSENVPEEFAEVLCCTDSDEIFIAKYLGKMNDGTACFDDDEGMMQEGDLIAWMPLPEPYKADGEGRRMTEIVKKLKAIAQDQNISQRELAKRMNNTETSVSRWFKGSRIPNAKNLEQMAAALGYRLTIEEDSK